MSLPPSEIPSGAMRFNSDSQKLEYWNGSAWFQVHTATPNLASAGDPTPGARGLWGGGSPTTGGNIIDYINISSTGNAIDFGDLSGNTKYVSAFSSSTRGVWGGGYGTPAFTNTLDYVTISTTGNAIDFGDMSYTADRVAGCSNGHGGL